jgi:hypothetical protein
LRAVEWFIFCISPTHPGISLHKGQGLKEAVEKVFLWGFQNGIGAVLKTHHFDIYWPGVVSKIL